MRRVFPLFLLLFAAVITACTSTPVPVRVLESWQPQEDSLSAQDAAREWRFSGEQGDEVRLRLNAKSGGQVTLELQDESGRTLAGGDDLRVELPASGIYTALVRLVAGDATSYSLALSYADRAIPSATPTITNTPTPTFTHTPTFTPTFTPTPTYTPTPTFTPTPVYASLGTLTGMLEMGVTVTNGFLSQFERHVYLFAGSEGQRVTISMAGASGTVDPMLTLFDPAGTPLATDDDSGGGSAALLREIRLPVDGEYIVQAIGGGAGEYRIGLQPTAPEPDQPTPTATPPLGTVTPVAAAELLDDHVPALGMIDRPGAFNRYFIDAESGDILTISVRPAEGALLRPRLEIYTPVGELMTSTGLGRDGQALIPSLGVIETGRYAVYVSDDGSNGGAYVIAYGRGDTYADDQRGGIEAETPVGNYRVLGVRQSSILRLSEGDMIEVQALGAVLQILDPLGAVVAEGQDAAQLTAQYSGDYRVYASGTAFALVWHYVVVAPTPAPALRILSADAPLPAQTYLYYPFQGEGGRRVRIRVEALDAGFDPVAALLDSSGAVVAEGDDSGDSLNPDFQALLPANGTYNLRINGYGDSGGSVSVTVELLS